MLILYRLLIFLLSPVTILYALYNPRLRIGLRQRLGLFQKEVKEALELAKEKPKVWFHGVSVGEVKLLIPLAKALKEKMPNFAFFFTTTTETGMKILREFSQDTEAVVSYFPLADIPFSVNRFVKAVKPKVFVSAEAEAWPNLLWALKRAGAKLCLVNARLYLKNKRRYLWKIYSWLYRPFDKILCQHSEALSAFRQIAVEESKLKVTGNLKFTVNIEPWPDGKVKEFREKFGWRKSFIFVAGSTHKGEEEQLLSAFEKIKVENENAVMALVPRHPERGKEVLQLARKMYFKAQRYTYYNEVFRPLSVLVVDEMGLLPSFYQIADVVILGGTFDEKVGGHNIYEPAFLRKPIILGPYVDSIKKEVEALKEKDAVIQVRNEAELEEALRLLFKSEEKRKSLGEKAFETLFSEQSALQQTAEEVAKLAGKA